MPNLSMKIIPPSETISNESWDIKEYNESESEYRVEYNVLLIKQINLIAF